MANYLATNRYFMNWWSDPQQMTCNESVTEVVTIQNVMRVTVCGLLELWGVLQSSIKRAGEDNNDGKIENAMLQYIDDSTGIPCFGEAMEFVGWVKEDRAGNLIFPNFYEHNVPDNERREAKTNAQRQHEYRERKKLKKEREKERNESNESVVTSNDRREEKRREEKLLKKENCKKEKKPKTVTFKKPTLFEIREYLEAIDSDINPVEFYNFYEASNWMRGKTKIQNWKACVRTWNANKRNG